MRLVALLSLALCLVPVQAPADGTVQLDRRSETRGWEAVGRIDSPSGFCTGTLIASDMVLTAAHCVYAQNGARYAPERIVFRAGYTHGKAVAERRVRRIAVPSAYSQSASPYINSRNMPYDVALLRLDRPILSATADPFRIHADPISGEAVSLLSYGRGRAEALTREARCAVTGRYSGGIVGFDCDATFGSSGAPVFVRYGTRFRIASIVSGGREEDGKKTTYGMELPAIVAALKTELRNAGARPVVSAGARRIQVGERGSTGARFVKP